MERQENSIQFGSKSMCFVAFDLRSFIQTVLSVTLICFGMQRLNFDVYTLHDILKVIRLISKVPNKTIKWILKGQWRTKL